MASKDRLDRAAGASIGGFFSNKDESMEKQEEKPTTKKSEKRQQDIEIFLEQLRQGKNQKEASEAAGHDKSWGSHVIAELKEKEPERLKGTPQEVKDAEKSPQDKPQTAQKPQEATKAEQIVKSTPIEEKSEEKANTKPQKQSFSFRADQDKIESWKLYAETIGAKDIGTLWTAAIDEYISNHALTADQQKIFKLKKQAADMAKMQSKL